MIKKKQKSSDSFARPFSIINTVQETPSKKKLSTMYVQLPASPEIEEKS
jgi:hypothetical protein